MLNAYALTPFSALDYPNELACIVWFPRCNFRCVYCHNPDLVEGKPTLEDEAYTTFLKNRIGKLTAVVFSGGEPTLCDALPAFAAEAKSMGFKVKVDTNGSCPTVIQAMIDQKILDYVALDFKCPPEKAIKLIGTDKFIKAHEETLAMLVAAAREERLSFEVRTTFPPDYLTEDDLNQMIDKLDSIGYRGVYYIQHIVSTGEKTLGNLPVSTRALDRSKIKEPKGFELGFRN